MDTLVQDGKRNSRQQVADSRTDIEAQAQRLVFVSRVVNCYPKPLSYSFFFVRPRMARGSLKRVFVDRRMNDASVRHC